MLPLDKFTADAQRALVESGIDASKVTVCLRLDLDSEGNFGEDWFFLCDKKLYRMGMAVYSDFPGKPGKTKANTKKSSPEFTLRGKVDFICPLEELSEFGVDSFVSSNRFTMKRGDSTINLGFCTNAKKQKLFCFIDICERISGGQEILDDDKMFEAFNIYCPKCGRPYNDRDRKLCLNCLNKGAIYKRLLKYFTPYKKQFVIIFLCLAASCAISLINPFLGGSFLYGRVLNINEPDNFIRGNVWLGVGIIFFIAVLSLVIQIIRSRANAEMSGNVTLSMKLDIFTAMQSLSLSYFNNNQTGRLITRVDYDAATVRGFFTDSLPALVVNVVTFVTAAIVMFSINWKLSLIVFIPVPIIIIIIKTMFPKLWRGYTLRWRRKSSMNAMLGDSLDGIRVVKAFAKEETETNRFTRYSDRLMKATLKLNAIQLCIFPIIGLLITMSSETIWGFGGILVMKRLMDYGTFITYIGYTAMIFSPLQFFTEVSDQLTNTANSAQRMFEVLDTIPEISEKPGAIDLKDMKGKIEFRDVCFSYNANRPILKNVSMTIHPGEAVGLVGHTGAGKSTIANLITRLYDVISGEIYIDDINIKDLTISCIRKNMAIVSQEIFLFNGTIADNIRYARPDASFEEVIAASKAANAHDFIINLPNGYETLVGTGNRWLSGGERQRVSIARALLLNPKILVLDEATAAMDTETERQIQDALARLIESKTTITIAHRLSTLKDCDTLYAIDDGRIVESGTHAELIAKRGVYFKLYSLQAEAMKKVIAE
ncbi:MAG: ABC transporter ATP-binding protein [Oscillospiraceae bacterium]|nr:ABC transporter ATP-binding protein [Oscillospiraceae bacterium]